MRFGCAGCPTLLVDPMSPWADARVLHFATPALTTGCASHRSCMRPLSLLSESGKRNATATRRCYSIRATHERTKGGHGLCSTVVMRCYAQMFQAAGGGSGPCTGGAVGAVGPCWSGAACSPAGLLTAVATAGSVCSCLVASLYSRSSFCL